MSYLANVLMFPTYIFFCLVITLRFKNCPSRYVLGYGMSDNKTILQIKVY